MQQVHDQGKFEGEVLARLCGLEECMRDIRDLLATQNGRVRALEIDHHILRGDHEKLQERVDLWGKFGLWAVAVVVGVVEFVAGKLWK